MDINKLLLEVAIREKCHPEDIQWYSWPQMFSSTSGPRGGCGGQAMTSFQVYAFDPPVGKKQKFCAGVWDHWNGQFQEKW